MAQKILIGFTCFFHFYAFILESFLWTKKIGLKTFRMSKEDAEKGKLLAFNQGFYNLFLAIALALGLVLLGQGDAVRGQTLIDYAMASAVGAGIVLLVSEPKLVRPAVLQAAPGVIYFLLRIFG